MVRGIFLVMVAVLLGGCSGGSDKASTGTTAAATSTVPSATSTTVADGRVPAYIRTVDVATRQVTYDQIQFLTGAEAKAAWIKDNPGPDAADGPPNDYYIKNVNPALYTVPIAPDATVTLNVLGDGSSTDKPGTLAQLKDGLSKDGSEYIPFWLTIKSGVITKIEEQFVP